MNTEDREYIYFSDEFAYLYIYPIVVFRHKNIFRPLSKFSFECIDLDIMSHFLLTLTDKLSFIRNIRYFDLDIISTYINRHYANYGYKIYYYKFCVELSNELTIPSLAPAFYSTKRFIKDSKIVLDTSPVSLKELNLFTVRKEPMTEKELYEHIIQSHTNNTIMCSL